MHRDIKTANILIDNMGHLKIADFGLARAHLQSVKDPKYTNMVVTRWYRPPELLLGATRYGPGIDMWGIGCVFGEILRRRPILVGNDDFDQMEKIWQLCGTPTKETWPGYKDLPVMQGQDFNPPFHTNSIKTVFKHFTDDKYFIGVVDLLDRILVCDPSKRFSTTDALQHHYFYAKPVPAVPGTSDFNCAWEHSHELSSRHRRQQQQQAAAMASDIPGMKPPVVAQCLPHYTMPADFEVYQKVMGYEGGVEKVGAGGRGGGGSGFDRGGAGYNRGGREYGGGQQ
ncbi:serine/threonine protein kinase, CMGC, CDC2/CDK sub, partial [Podochytrium sp. JEL0797]